LAALRMFRSALPRRSDFGLIADGRVVQWFRSALPRRSDAPKFDLACIEFKVSIRAPAKERRDRAMRPQGELGVSIRAPAKERQRRRHPRGGSRQVSIRAPAKERRLTRSPMCGAVISSPLLLTFLAGAFFKLGQPGDGVSRLHEAAQFIENTDERYCESEVYRLTADLLKMTGDQAVAEQSYCKALALADRQNAKAHQLRTAISMARLWRDQGKRDEARDLLAPVYGWFTEGFDTLDLKEAKKLLNELVWPLSGDRD
jgi:hypothetical protein